MAAVVDAATGGAGGVEGGVILSLDFMKARPVEEGGRRYVYCEAGNESWDQQNERIMKSALLGSRELFLRQGNIDIDHMTVLGYALKIPNPHSYEIGLPLEVREGPSGVFVKGEIYRGNARADEWWHSVTKQEPPMRWFPSVYGHAAPDGKRDVFDPSSQSHRTVITKALWKGLAFAKTPQNLSVPGVSVQPFGAFAKAAIAALEAPVCIGDHCDCIKKAVEGASYATDSTALSGGAALRGQSLDRELHDVSHGGSGAAARYLKALETQSCAHAEPPITHQKIVDHFVDCEHMPPADARQQARRFLERASTRLKAAA